MLAPPRPQHGSHPGEGAPIEHVDSMGDVKFTTGYNYMYTVPLLPFWHYVRVQRMPTNLLYNRLGIRFSSRNLAVHDIIVQGHGAAGRENGGKITLR